MSNWETINKLHEQVALLTAALRDIEAAAMRNNGPIARNHTDDALRAIGLHAAWALNDIAETSHGEQPKTLTDMWYTAKERS